ncbi:MAG: hypothetical protein H6712_05745 [Myxococcales bacterium]|nr:hypothetical protein [Myxococcales bacterium]MCB9713338.1 hypothetical protein [Myxococcales bacterium]
MNRSTGVLALCLLTSALGCNDSPTEVTADKGKIDRAALEGGITIQINGDVGSVSVPFEVAVPEASGDSDGDGDQLLEDELSAAVSLVVTSNVSGSTADLSSGTIVDAAPAGPGEWSWTLNGSRDMATMEFFNSSVSGLTLKPENTYSAMLSVASNGYVETEAAFSFNVTIVSN